MIEALAWPVVGLVLGLVAIAAFRAPIVKKIERISRAGKDGISFDRPQEIGQTQAEELSYESLMKHPISASALEREKVVSNHLLKLPLKTDAERIAILVRVVATTNVEHEYTRIANQIFGSQQSLLVQLAGTRTGLALTQAKEAFAKAKSGFPALHEARPFESWIGYLEANNLIKTKDGQIDITQYGSDYLKYLVDARLAYDRFG